MSAPLIVETDLGHDPDDLFTILYLVAAGVRISAIVITPGDLDQIAIARLVCDQLGLDIPIGAASLTQTKLSSGSVHHALLKRYGRSLSAAADDLGDEVIRSIHTSDTEILVIGPVTNVSRWFETNKGCWPRRATMQGGFVPYSLHRPAVTLAAFEGKQWMPTFNLNGNRKGGERFLAGPFPRQMVGKNVCHTVLLDKARLSRFAPAINRASELFHEAAAIYFAGHDAKKFHDPVAAVCHLHPEVGVWMDGKTVKREGGWTTIPGEDKVLVDLDRDTMWSHLEKWT